MNTLKNKDMKKLSIFSFIIGILGLLAAIVNQFYYIPKAKALELFENSLDDYSSPSIWAEVHHFTVVLGEVVVISCAVALILALIPVFKTKAKLAIVAAIIALIGLFMGLAQGTHMFS